MTKEFLDNIENLSNEINSLESRLEKIEEKENRVVADSVQTSSKTFPYTLHSTTIIGIKTPHNSNLKRKYKKMIKNKQYKLDKLKLQLEYELNYITDSAIRDIIRYKYNDNLSWVQIMFKMNYKSESTAKMKLNRFFQKKNPKCDKCDD